MSKHFSDEEREVISSYFPTLKSTSVSSNPRLWIDEEEEDSWENFSCRLNNRESNGNSSKSNMPLGRDASHQQPHPQLVFPAWEFGKKIYWAPFNYIFLSQQKPH